VKTHHHLLQVLKFKDIQIISGHLHIYLRLPDPEDIGTMNLQSLKSRKIEHKKITAKFPCVIKTKTNPPPKKKQYHASVSESAWGFSVRTSWQLCVR